MTILGRFNQRRELRKTGLHKVKSPMKGGGHRDVNQQYPTNTTALTIKASKKSIHRFSNGGGSDHDPIEIDSVTTKAIEMEVQDLLELSTRKSATVGAIANALKISRRVKDTHASQGKQKILVRLINQMKSMAIGSKKRGQQEKDAILRRYDLMNALSYLEKQPDSHKRTATSWEEAKSFLEVVFKFPDESKQEAADEDDKGSSKPPKNDEDDPRLYTYQASLELAFATDNAEYGMKPRHEKWKQVAAVSPPGKFSSRDLGGAESDDYLTSQILAAEAKVDSHKSQAVKDIAEGVLKEEEARERASSLMRPLTEGEREIVRDAMEGYGYGDEVIARSGTDSVQRSSMQTLQPGQWVGDEVISYFLLMLSKRDEELCQKEPGRKRCHFFKSFFMTKLLNEGHADINKDGTYEYNNVKRWSKKVPGKDIFNLDKIIFPINIGRQHWVCAVAFMTEKRIQVYDSMGSGGSYYLDSIFRYLQDEHMAKKGCPLPGIDEWQLIPTTPDTPQQLNGYDCGVFTCMAADFISKGDPLVYSQQHITQCRQRIALSIMNGKAIM